MSHDFIGDLLNALTRVLSPEVARLKEVLILSGMPEETDNLRYLGFNRQVVKQDGRTLEFSAVAVVNNRRAAQWRLTGVAQKLSRMVFHPRWTHNPLNLFLHRLRCDPTVMDLLASAGGDYTLLGILTTNETLGRGLFKRHYRSIRPVVAVTGLDAAGVEALSAFEAQNEIRQVKLRGLPHYCRITRKFPPR
jgi:hypothetical protein